MTASIIPLHRRATPAPRHVPAPLPVLYGLGAMAAGAIAWGLLARAWVEALRVQNGAPDA